MVATLDQAEIAAAQAGLTLSLSSRPSPTGELFVVSVSRESGDWTLSPTEIAVAKSPEEAARRAMDAIATMLPRLNKHLVAMGTGSDEQMLNIAAGVSSEGVVSTLRVERDGTVRLAGEDIEAIAEAVYRLQRRAK